MMYFHRYITFVFQDLKVKMKLIIIVMGIVTLLMFAATVPGNSIILLKWHSTKDYVLLFRYEFFHIPLFLILMGSIFKLTDWQILRRFNSREQIGTYKIFTVFVISILFSIIMMLLGSICTSVVKFIFYPNIINYTSIFLYVPESEQKNSFAYFAYVYFFITTIIGLIFISLANIIKNKILSAIILIVFVILDRFTFSLIPYFMYLSEITSPISNFFVLFSVLIILINLVHFTSNNINYYNQEEKI